MAVATTPTGYSGAAALAQIRAYANEQQLPPDQTILNFLNKGVEETVRRFGGIRLWAGYPTVVNQTTVQLGNDVMDIVSANFSIGNANSQNNGSASPFAQGTLVYPMTQLEQAAFMDAAAGFPAVGFGPPQAFFIYQDEGLAPSQALPAPAAPQLSAVPDTGIFLEWNVTNWNQGDWFAQQFSGDVEVVITYTDPQGETTVSPVADISLQLGFAAQVASPEGIGDADGYNVYAGDPGGPYFLQNTTPVPLGTPFVIPPPFGSSGAAPPTVNTTGGGGGGGSLWMQLYPAAMIGQVNIYYRARPTLWADVTDDAYTNLDTSLQEAAVIFATGRVLLARGRAQEWVQIWKPDYEAMVADMKESANRRTMPKSGQVRDVRNRAYPSSPWWIG